MDSRCDASGVWYYSTVFLTEAGLPNPMAGTLLASSLFMLATILAVPLIEQAWRLRPIHVGLFGSRMYSEHAFLHQLEAYG